MGQQVKALVTGGGGFLGRAITEQLLARGDAVTILARGRYPEVEALGASSIQLDLTQPDGLTEAVRGHDVVFHVASKTGVWGPREEFMRVNVEGTDNLLEACREAGVQRLVYTSSPSATFNGTDAINATEADCPYPDHFEADYPESKAIAERHVLRASDEAMATTALRPHLIWGPRDPHIIPRLMLRRKQGRLARVGDGTNKVAITYIDNAAANGDGANLTPGQIRGQVVRTHVDRHRVARTLLRTTTGALPGSEVRAHNHCRNRNRKRAEPHRILLCCSITASSLAAFPGCPSPTTAGRGHDTSSTDLSSSILNVCTSFVSPTSSVTEYEPAAAAAPPRPRPPRPARPRAGVRLRAPDRAPRRLRRFQSTRCSPGVVAALAENISVPSRSRTTTVAPASGLPFSQ